MKTFIFIIALITLSACLAQESRQEMRDQYRIDEKLVKTMDANKDRCVTMAELESYRAQNSDYMTGKTTKEIFTSFDKDQNKCISYIEFLDRYLVNIKNDPSRYTFCREAYDEVQHKKTNCIRQEEFVAFFRQQNDKHNDPVEQAQEIMDEIDFNQDKCLDFDEFLVSFGFQ